MWRLLAAGALIALNLSAAPKPNPAGSTALSEGGGPQFRCQLGERLSDSPDSLRLTVAMSVPFDNLVFLRTDTGFAAQSELTISLFLEGSGLLSERVITLLATTQTFVETNSRTQSVVHVDEFVVSPGEYQVRVTLVSDRQTGRKSKWEGSINMRASDPRLRVSDIYWISERQDLAERGVPRVIEGFSTTEREARAVVEIFSTGSEDMRLQWNVLDARGDTVRTLTDNVSPARHIQTCEFPLTLDGLSAQQYVLRLEVEGNGRREVRTRPFSIRIPGIPASITDLGEAIRQLKYIASADENSRLKQADLFEREELFKQFWKRRDPTPNTEENELMDEYYARVEYANEKFATNRPGWESDRGRIFILYGEPTDIERHPFESATRPYEIWFYSHLARRFIFVDYTGFGDYTLVTPEWGY